MREKVIAVLAMARCFADDVVCRCGRCGATTYARPHTALLPFDRICIDCWRKDGQRGEIVLTEDTLREVLLYYGARGRPQ